MARAKRSARSIARDELIAAAHAVRGRAYAKYSQFFVGAAIRAGDGKIYAGCNVENASYGLTICAERSAVFAAVSAGQKRLEMLALVTAGGYPPCGACRQVLAEFAPELPILILDANEPGKVIETDLATLLPGRFEFEPEAARVKRGATGKKIGR
jgi:cytidine deaminase